MRIPDYVIEELAAVGLSPATEPAMGGGGHWAVKVKLPNGGEAKISWPNEHCRVRSMKNSRSNLKHYLRKVLDYPTRA